MRLLLSILVIILSMHVGKVLEAADVPVAYIWLWGACTGLFLPTVVWGARPQ